MKIALDLRRIKNLGIGRYMICLVEALLAQDPLTDYLLILPPGAEGLIRIAGTNAEVIISDLKYYSVREQLQLPKILSHHKVDLLHSPHFVLPLMRPCPSVVTIHDVIGIACKDDLGSQLGRLYYRAMISAAVRLADKIITDSNFSREDIVRLLGISPEKIEVIYPGISSNFQPVKDCRRLDAIRSKYKISHEFMVYAGIFKPRKNHAALLRAFQKFLSYEQQANLVLVGPSSAVDSELRRLALELGIANNLIFTGVVDDLELAALYSAARVYACPSVYEGFGFTVLEAMACGTPVVCNPRTSLQEVAGDAALYANPANPDEFAHALFQAFSDPAIRDTLQQNARKNLQRFSWSNTAAQTLAVYHQAMRISDRSTTVTLAVAPTRTDKSAPSN
jgi:glycosyltransferase involved in cell wall biosynthesis